MSDKCWNCGNTEDLNYQFNTGELGTEEELTEIHGFECPNCDEWTTLETRSNVR